MNRQAYTDAARHGIITEEELSFAPLADCHKQLVTQHFHRLVRIAHATDEGVIGRYTTKPDAREQLARMTLVIRDYIHRQAATESDIEAGIESMVADVVDASFFVSGKRGTFAQPAFVNPLLFGREQEIAALMQEMRAQGDDDVIELWHSPSSTTAAGNDTVLPEVVATSTDIGAAIDWDHVLRRARSDNDIVYLSTKAELAMEALRLEEKERQATKTQVRPPRRPRRATQLLLRKPDGYKSLSWPPVAPTAVRLPRRAWSGFSVSLSSEDWWGWDE